MKSRKFLTALTVLLLLVPFLTVSAYDHLISDSENWKNITDDEANDLIFSLEDDKDQSFILIFYSDTCGYSTNYVPQFEAFAKNNGILLHGIDGNEFPDWYNWLEFADKGYITYPLVVAYNHENDSLYYEDTVHSVASFEYILSEVEYPLIPQEDTEEDEETQTLFIDVDSNNKYYKAIKSLVEKGILTGYEDNTFKPDNTITRAEAATVIVRAAGISTDNNARSIYLDLADNYWATPYIMAATEAGIINGMGDDLFAPTSNVTHNQIIKMVVCMMGLDADINKATAWPIGYLGAAANNGIISIDKFKELRDTTGNTNATRGDVAQYIYNALKINDKKAVYIGDKRYYIGMSADELDAPDEILTSTSVYDWYVYGTTDYTDFIAVGVKDDTVVALAASGVSFTYLGYKAGDLNEEKLRHLATDDNDNNIIHGIFIDESGEENGNNTDEEALAGESKMNFHFTNGFRVYHGKRILKWCDDAALAAQLHSEDMASEDYFSHNSLDGTKFSQRMREQGVFWSTCGENISAGRYTGFHSYCGWVNSAGHRTNMINNAYKYLGVGAGYSRSSTYKFYFTQDFYS